MFNKSHFILAPQVWTYSLYLLFIHHWLYKLQCFKSHLPIAKVPHLYYISLILIKHSTKEPQSHIRQGLKTIIKHDDIYKSSLIICNYIHHK